MHHNLVLLCLVGVTTVLGWRQGGSGFMYPPKRPEGVQLPPDQWYTQSLNHFNPSDTRTWQQRYFTNDSFYEPGGPVFLMIGGEGPADPVWMVEGSWVTYAQSLKAYMLFLEHRYYGKSHPTEDVSVENLAYLSTEQALADLAAFIVDMQESLGFEDNKWIVFGGSYSGSLAAWFRMKYPHLAHGAVATSAPIVAQVNFKEYLEVVRDSLATVSEDCNTQIKEAHRELDMLLLHQIGWRTITTEFRLCTPLDARIADDVSNMFSLLAENIEDVVQYNKDNRAFEGVKGTNITIDTICGIMMNEDEEPIDRYADVNSMILDVYGKPCLEHTYHAMIEELQATSWENNESVGGRAWMYQTCTEYGFYQSSDSENQPFGDKFPIEFFIKQCEDIYGPKFNLSLLEAGVKRTNTIFGGRDLKVTRVVFPNGSIDPWHALGITSDISNDATAIYINGTAHCANEYPDSPDDPSQLTAAREEVYQLITQWLNEE
ncbi:putative serine protease K12H4.7 [Homarus americanus]|uniref:putative serine protease K12H4.7 n=1 Tax=Homarus americanus TaxID=6706 RepID=UPI001C47EB92|nr:putative serine protease K12H4.7 [Homarus americanus]